MNGGMSDRIGKAGNNSFSFDGILYNNQTGPIELAPGSYQLTATGSNMAAKSISFRITP